MKEFTTAINTLLGLPVKSPVHLYEIELLNLGYLRYASARQAVSFNNIVWYPKGIRHTLPTEASAYNRVGKITVKFADGEGSIRSYNNLMPLKGRTIKCSRIFRENKNDPANVITIFSGLISQVSWDYQWFITEVAAGNTLRQTFPRRKYIAKCPWKPGGSECNMDGFFDITTTPFLVTGTASGSGIVFQDLSRAEADDYWNCGNIRITTDLNQIFFRKVTDFQSGGTFHLDLPIPGNAAMTVQYSLSRGCDQTWDACAGNKPYGPSADNQLNYGGFLHVSTEK